MGEKNVLIVMVGASDSVKTRNIKLPFAIDEIMVKSLTAVLNQYLTGISINEMNISLMVEMENYLENISGKEKKLCSELVSICVKSIYETLNELGSEIKFEGVLGEWSE